MGHRAMARRLITGCNSVLIVVDHWLRPWICRLAQRNRWQRSLVSISVYVGDCIQILKGMKAESVHCMVTSPPFWGLRDYGLPATVWGGDVECEHVWGEELPEHHPGQVPDSKWKNNPDLARGQTAKTGQFCQCCGAWQGCLGLEPSPELYVEHIVEIFRHVRRVLRKDAVVWLNLGDSYASVKGTCYNPGEGESSFRKTSKSAGAHPLNRGNVTQLRRSNLKPKDLVGIPWMVALALRDDAWWLRSDLIWAKGVSGQKETEASIVAAIHRAFPGSLGNRIESKVMAELDLYVGGSMPESVNGWRWERHRRVQKSARAHEDSYHAMAYDKPQSARDGRNFASSTSTDCPGCSKCEDNDGYILRKGSGRPSKSHEYVFLLAKSKSYFYDKLAIVEPSVTNDPRKPYGSNGAWEIDGRDKWSEGAGKSQNRNAGIRNRRSVWQINTEPLKAAHFATFPKSLVRPMILAGTSAYGVCEKCGAPWVRVVYKRSKTTHIGKTDSAYPNGSTANRLALLRQAAREKGSEYTDSAGTEGWKPTCDCGCDEVVPATVLDIFSGAGTTGLVCAQEGRSYIGIELNPEYAQMSKDRIEKDTGVEVIVT